MNYFELFDMPICLQIDKNELAKKYVELQKKFHPDFFINTTAHEQMQALEKSSEINKALHIFKHPDETIKYVLQLKGILQEDEKYQLPPDFLMEVMEINEGLSAHSLEPINELKASIYLPVKNIIQNFNEATTTPEELNKVKEYYYKKKYLQRILERING